MNISVFSTSRADHGALKPVAAELNLRNGVSAKLIDWVPGQSWQATDLAVLCGDRFETLELAFRLNYHRVPIAHLSGGDVTEGSQDDSYRHAITKLSHLHFPTSMGSFNRIIQMGEERWRVHLAGSPAVDNIRDEAKLTRAEALASVGLLDQDFVLICMHPNTMGEVEKEIIQITNYFQVLPKGMGVVVIGPNNDVGASQLKITMQQLASQKQNAVYVDQVDRPIYLSLLKHCEWFAGNSSAALYEAPTFNTATVLIGDRQKGRSTVLGDGRASWRIANVLEEVRDPKLLLRKKFIDLNIDGGPG